jgi:hypothetical protein
MRSKVALDAPPVAPGRPRARVRAHLRDHIFRQQTGPPRGKSQTPCPLAFKRRASPDTGSIRAQAGRGYREKRPVLVRRCSRRGKCSRRGSSLRSAWVMCLYTAACGVDAPGDHRSNREKGRRDEAAESTSNLESEYRWPTAPRPPSAGTGSAERVVPNPRPWRSPIVVLAPLVSLYHPGTSSAFPLSPLGAAKGVQPEQLRSTPPPRGVRPLRIP